MMYGGQIMRAIKLILSAFGPYSQETIIEFDKLGEKGLYLIAGDTGSGKTTIFDAITFALYGSSSGGLRDSKMFRSEYADINTKSFVEFIFSYKGLVYRIYRNPAYMRPAKRGDGLVQEEARAVLYVDDKVIDKTSEVNEYIVNLFGITETQFKQIAMIAQGDFLKLLHASNDEKRELFRRIFSTEKFSLIEDKIRKEKSEIESKHSQLKKGFYDIAADVEVDDQLKSLLLDYAYSNRDEFERILNDDIKATRKAISQIQKERADKDKLISTKNTFIEKVEDFKDRKAEIQSNEFELKDLNELYEALLKEKEDNKNIDVEIDSIKLEIDQKVKNLKNYDELDLYIEKIDILKKDINKSKEAYSNLLSSIDEIKTNLASITKFIDDNKDCESKLYKLKRQDEILRSKLESIKEINNKYKKLKATAVNLEKTKILLGQKHEEYKLLKSKVDLAEDVFYRSQAGLLAEELADNEPCPVCGSLSHPNPAQKGDDALDKSALDALHESLEHKAKERDLASQEVTRLESQESHEINLIEEDLKALEIDLSYKEAINNLKEMDASTKKLCEENSNKLKREQNIFEDLEKYRINQKEMNECLGQANEKSAGLASKLAVQERDLEHDKASMDKLQDKLEFSGKKEAKANIKGLEKSRDDFIAKKNRLEERLSETKTNIFSHKTLLVNLRAKQDERYDIETDSLIEELDIMRADNAKLFEEEKLISAKNTHNERLLKKYKQSSESFKELDERFKDINDIYNTVTGQISGKAKLQFEVFVQTTYFDEIISRANIRFAEMTSGQYQLRRKEGATDNVSQSGLELEIIDKYSAKPRNIKTLSGGESFKAALSLALGLSDTVQMYSGGVQIDSMFIDEGFGSLDKESLNQVMHALSDLTKTNKIIGIISHVESLKEAIDKKILVTKDNKGSSHIEIIY